MLVKRHYVIPDGWEPIRNTIQLTAETTAQLAADPVLFAKVLQDPSAYPQFFLDKTRPLGALLNPLPIDSLDLRHTGVQAAQNFSRRVVDAGVAEGWASLSKGQLLLHTNDEDLVYTILRTPGTYCCHCGAGLGDDASGALGRQHVGAMHAGVSSPDPQNPAGYRRTQAYECVLDAEQHARWKRPAGATVSGWRGEKRDAGATKPTEQADV